jgi:hypothetical protein
MSRHTDEQKLEDLDRAIRTHPGKKPSFLARLLGWHQEEVSRRLATPGERKRLYYEDKHGGLHTFDRRNLK